MEIFNFLNFGKEEEIKKKREYRSFQHLRYILKLKNKYYEYPPGHCTPNCKEDAHCTPGEYCDYPEGGVGNCVSGTSKGKN